MPNRRFVFFAVATTVVLTFCLGSCAKKQDNRGTTPRGGDPFAGGIEGGPPARTSSSPPRRTAAPPRKPLAGRADPARAGWGPGVDLSSNFRPPAGTGAIIEPQRYKRPSAWLTQVKPDPRAELIIPVNFVRIYSDQHKAEQMAPRRWILTQLQISNILYRLSDGQMKTYSKTRPAPVIQFTLNKIYDVHEKSASGVLGIEVDTENTLGGGSRLLNGRRIANTWDLRKLKVKGETHVLTVFCVWDGKNTDQGRMSGFGGESNIGFAEIPKPPKRGVLIKVSGTRARMGVITIRRHSAWMNNIAHEFGHYFGLFHAWNHQRNRKNGISDLGNGPMRAVDPRRTFANTMDYDNGDGVKHYFTRDQLAYMYKFARDKASTQITVFRGRRRPAPVVDPRPGPRPTPRPAPKPATAKVERVWIDPVTPGSAVKVHARFGMFNSLSRGGEVVIWFYGPGGKHLTDADGQFRTPSGHVAVGGKFVPKWERTVFTNYALTLPAGQLHLTPGRHSLAAVVGIFQAGKLLTKSAPSRFEYVVPGAPPKPAETERSAFITKLAVTEKVIVDGHPHVRVTAQVLLDNLKGVPAEISARFYFKDGRPLKDFDGGFRSPEGLAFVKRDLVSKFPRTRWSNVHLLMPYKELHLQANATAELKAAVSVRYGGKTLTSRFSTVFSVSTGSTSATVLPAARSASIDKVWTKHNIRWGGKLGMVVQAQVRITGYRNRPLQYIAWFNFANGQPLKDSDGNYRTGKGQVAAYTTLKPPYDKAIYRKATIFIPYSQLHLARGQHQLQVTLALFDGTKRIARSSSPARFNITQN